jgi:NAD(P)-dependent dehydrogenase (short-subunit alcohol dehydrogenase family)
MVTTATDLTVGKTFLITGASNGIGKATAHAIAATGGTIVIHGRDPVRTEATRTEIRAASKNDDIHLLLADFASLDQVRALAMEFQQKFGALHGLINNAGLLTDHRQLSHEGYELTFAVNHLAPFLLTNLLLPTLVDSAPARIAMNSSSAMGSAQIDLDDLHMEKRFDGWTAYANTKLANVLFSNLLAQKLAESRVVSNAFCPGLVDSGLLTGNRDFGTEGIERLRPRMRTPEEGAITPVFLATTAEAEQVSGAFFLKSHGSGKTPVRIPWDADLAETLWDASLEHVVDWLG